MPRYIITRNGFMFVQGPEPKLTTDMSDVTVYADPSVAEDHAMSLAHTYRGEVFRVCDSETMRVLFSVHWNN